MAKRLVRWELNNSTLKMIRVIGEGEKTTELPVEFDLTKLFPDFANFTDVQKQLVAYGVKQKLSDTGASKVGDFGGKIKVAKTRWADLLAGKWQGERVNATGATAARTIAKKIKEASNVVSLEGLVVKKQMAALPGFPEFTAEDQKKLDELLLVAAKAIK